MLDSCAILWTIHWPSPGQFTDRVLTVNLFATMETFLKKKLIQSDVRQILSIQSKGLQKSRRSSAREKGQLHLTLNSLLPPQAASLSIVEKVHILDLLCDALMDRFQRLVTDKELVITGSDPVGLPYSIQRGKHKRRMDLKVTHEEADVIIVNIVNHVVLIAKQTLPKTIHVISDNTDVFVLLVHFVAS